MDILKTEKEDRYSLFETRFLIKPTVNRKKKSNVTARSFDSRARVCHRAHDDDILSTHPVAS